MSSIGEYLQRCQYRNVAEWAIDSGYVYDESTDEWTDEHGTVVDPTTQLLVAIEALEVQ